MKLTWKTCFRIGFSVFLLYLCITYWKNVSGLFSALFGAASPLLIGCVLAYVVNILMKFYERYYFPKTSKSFLRKSRRPVCMVGSFLTVIAIVVLVVSLVLPQLISCVQLLLSELPGAITFVIEKAENLGIFPSNIIASLSEIDWQSRIGSILEAFTSGVGNVMDLVLTAVTSVFSGIVTGLLSTIFAFYLLISKDTLKRQVNRVLQHYLPAVVYEKVIYVATLFDDCFHRYIVGQCTEAVILGLLCTAGMLLLRLPYATMIGALIAFTALIPVAGAYIGAVVGAFMIVTVAPVKALIFLIFILILQQVEGNIIYPRVVGSSLGLPGIWVLAAVTIGGGMLGVPGMLLGVPIASVLYRILQDDLNGEQRLRLQTQKNNTNKE